MLVYDPKADPEAVLPGMAEAFGVEAALRALPGRVVYRPTAAERRNLAESFDRLAERLYALGGHGLLLHELGDFADTDRELDSRAPFLAACYRQGRFRRVPILSCTQRPYNVPLMAFSEARHLAAYHLVARRDRERMAEYMGERVAKEPVPPDFSWWYRSPDLSLIRCAPLERT